MLASILWIIAIATVLVVPALIIWGWVRWSRNSAGRTVSSTLSFVGFSFSTASAMLALLAHLYARFIRSFPSYDPALSRIYVCGCLLSSVGILFAVGGTGRRGPVRLLSPACAFLTLLFWLLALSCG
jgi:hypothetical protein